MTSRAFRRKPKAGFPGLHANRSSISAAFTAILCSSSPSPRVRQIPHPEVAAKRPSKDEAEAHPKSHVSDSAFKMPRLAKPIWGPASFEARCACTSG